MSGKPAELVRFVSGQLAQTAVPKNVPAMQAYLKTGMPFYGVANPARLPIFREMVKRFVPANRREYEASIRALWRLPHREEKYAAIYYAYRHGAFVSPASLPLYETMIRQGGWWDLVDFLVCKLISPLYLAERGALKPAVNRWIDDDDLWVRRTALLSHYCHKRATDERQLFRHCLRRAGETDFFIRKAIGWALWQYSYADPKAVRTFLLTHREQLSGLSFREGAKVLVRRGEMAS
jgi:3-methyladenine DNA glycosylase AlkD